MIKNKFCVFNFSKILIEVNLRPGQMITLCKTNRVNKLLNNFDVMFKPLTTNIRLYYIIYKNDHEKQFLRS